MAEAPTDHFFTAAALVAEQLTGGRILSFISFPLLTRQLFIAPLSRAGIKSWRHDGGHATSSIFYFFHRASLFLPFLILPLPSLAGCRGAPDLIARLRVAFPYGVAAAWRWPSWSSPPMHIFSWAVRPPPLMRAGTPGVPRPMSAPAPSDAVYSCSFRSRRAVPAACTCKSRRACVLVVGLCVYLCVLCVYISALFWGPTPRPWSSWTVFSALLFLAFFLDGRAALV